MKTTMKQVSIALTLMLATTSVYGQQVCNPNLLASSPDSEFEVNGDGTVTHTPTGLMWSVCLTGQTHMFDGTCEGAALEETWEGAHVMASGEFIGGYSDWRLPNVNELVSILEYQCATPALNLNIFPGASDAITLWTSTPTTMDGIGNGVLVIDGVPEPMPMVEPLPFLLVREN
ncbi:MAG: outer membrane protein of unknown function DUF1566 [Idiomarinaceae bacterium HL-53]|nr:MAG: outer membrane protein of unknown function DUF1566 [Idiomarinaceae bacterium HL-53]CUS48434.1 Protein of unknown function (DUF1566) [Idiomarinaceae bacterium HL-53]